jgi:hypothetical protein
MRVTATWAGIGGLLFLCLATPARAECGSCLDGLVAVVASIAVYGIIGIILLVMLIRAKWRRAGLWSLAVVLTLAIGVPLASQAVQVGKVWAMERHEILGTLPDISQRTPLVIAADGPASTAPAGPSCGGGQGRRSMSFRPRNSRVLTCQSL